MSFLGAVARVFRLHLETSLIVTDAINSVVHHFPCLKHQLLKNKTKQNKTLASVTYKLHFLAIRQCSISTSMSRYFSQFWQGVDNAPSQQKWGRELAPLTFRFSDYIAHLIWLILGMSEAEMAAQRFGGGGGGGGVCTTPSIQLVLISTMERREGKKRNNNCDESSDNEMNYSWVKAYRISQLWYAVIWNCRHG